MNYKIVGIGVLVFLIGFSVCSIAFMETYTNCEDKLDNSLNWRWSCENQLQRCSHCLKYGNQSDCEKVCSYEGWKNWMQEGEGKEIWLK